MGRAALEGRLALDRWSRGRSSLHRLDARWKLLACLAALAALSLLPAWPGALVCSALGFVLALAAGLPLFSVMLRAAWVLPFALVFAILTAFGGDVPRAATLLAKTYASALCAVLLMATTPMERVLGAMNRLGVPSLLVEVIHFIWRYLHVVVEQAFRIRTAADVRGGSRSFRISASSVAVLLATSYARAGRIHRAILARNGTGAFQ
jgi:cobalt/nickel transport system permease protein